MKAIKKLYLFFYNAVLTGGWAYLLFLVINHYLIQKAHPQDLYSVIEVPLKVFQSLAIMEIVHSIVGLVPSPVFTTVMQVWSRLFVVWFIMDLEHDVKYTEVQSYAIATVMIAWCITEIIRYSFYALKLYDMCPYPLLWLRYTLFYVLYPMGVASELALTFFRMPYYKQQRPFSLLMPNQMNWSFDSYIFVWIMVLGYIPGFPQLFGYMVHQRKKVLNPTPATATTTAAKKQN